ncbi:MAG: hypothetical protein D6E12_06255 [Desulfovibrio sp.]|nr:MAG: hypothetical protein D6E12_06255 [Desulfovibrio sp.]
MPANVPHSAPARRTGALGVIIAIVNMVFATAGLAWLVYALIKTGPEYVDLTNFEYSQWFLIFGLALIAIFFSGIIAFTGYGWGFVPAAWGYVLVLWLWQGMFARFMDDDREMVILILLINLLTLVVIGRIIWGVINRRVRAAAGRRAGALGTTAGLLTLIYALAGSRIMHSLLFDIWYGPTLSPGKELFLLWGTPWVLPLVLGVLLVSAHTTLDGRRYTIVADILGHGLLVAVTFMYMGFGDLSVTGAVIYIAALGLLVLAMIHHIMGSASRKRWNRGPVS